MKGNYSQLTHVIPNAVRDLLWLASNDIRHSERSEGSPDAREIPHCVRDDLGSEQIR